MNDYVYQFGLPGKRYGIWNAVQKEWQFGLCEATPMIADAKLHAMIGRGAYKYRFEARTLPQEEVARIMKNKHKNRPKGKWVHIKGTSMSKCSECGEALIDEDAFDGQIWNYCPICGKLMEGNEFDERR